MTEPLQLPNAQDDMGEPAQAGEPINVSSSDWVPTLPGTIATRWLVVGVAGIVTFDTGVQSGIAIYLPIGVWKIAAVKVHASGTTAGSLGALY